MPRPEPRTITFTIDGREVQAPENMMLADAAKLLDIAIHDHLVIGTSGHSSMRALGLI